MKLLSLITERLLYWLDCTIGRRPIFFYQDWHKTIRVDQYGQKRTLSFGGKLYQSVASNDNSLQPTVWNYFLLSPFFLPNTEKPFRVCILGFGGGVVAKNLVRFLPNASVTGVEIDPVVADLAKCYFDIPKSIMLTCTDAKDFIALTKQMYDIIMVDIFNGNKTIDLVYQDNFLDNCVKHLTNTGLLAINFYDQQEKKKLFLLTKLHDRNLSITTTQVVETSIHNTLIFAAKNRGAYQNIEKNLRSRLNDDLSRFVKTLKKSINRVQ